MAALDGRNAREFVPIFSLHWQLFPSSKNPFSFVSKSQSIPNWESIARLPYLGMANMEALYSNKNMSLIKGLKCNHFNLLIMKIQLLN